MKTIVAATDFSPSALNAANYAADMAVAINADLLLLYVYQLPVNYSEVPVSINERDFMDDTKKSINALKKQLSSGRGGRLHISTEVRAGIFFRQELENACEGVKPYAVVMGSQGTTAVKHLVFGNHTLSAMKHLMWPLIAVPPGATFSSIKKIGLASDFNKVIETTPLDEIKTLVNDFNAELHVLHTGQQLKSNPDFNFESGLLEEMLGHLKPNYHFITNENTNEGIIDFAEKNEIDMLIVLPKRHDLLNKLIHKSHTKQMVLYCHIPVMALHL